MSSKTDSLGTPLDLTVAHRELVRDDLDLAIRLGPRPTEEGYVTSRLRVGSGRIALSACRAGLGVAGLPTFMCARDLSSGALVRVLPEWQLPSAGIWALSTIPITRSVTLRAFVDLVRARLAG